MSTEEKLGTIVGETEQLLSGAPHSQRAGSSLEHDDATDTDNRIHRLEAVSMHRRRALKQIAHAIFVVVVASLAPIYWTINSNGTLDLQKLSAQMRSLADALPDGNALLVPSVAAVATILGSLWLRIWYRRERDRDWAESSAKANATEPQTLAQGYMALFRLYARTKRRATFVMLYGVLSSYWAFLGILASWDITNGFEVLTATAIQLVASLLVTYQGYDIGRRYLPGNVLVTKTLTLGFRAATGDMQYQDAVREAEKAEVEIVDDKPWWFYAYRIPRQTKK